MLVVGTSARVSPASDYIRKARDMGALIIEFNISEDEQLFETHFFWPGDVSQTLPEFMDLIFPSLSPYPRP